MANFFEIPTTPNPQTFSITLSGVQYRLTLKWNVTAQIWVLDIADIDNNLLVAGICVVTGTDLLEPFGYLNFNGQIFASTDTDPASPPNFENLGTTGHIYWVTP